MSAENIVTCRINMSAWQRNFIDYRNFMYKFNIQIFVSFKIVFIPKICNKVFKAITSISMFLVEFFISLLLLHTFLPFYFIEIVLIHIF